MIDSVTIEQARSTDIIAFFEQRCGFTFVHQGQGHGHGGEYRCKQHPSLAVKGDRLSWYWHSKGIGGYGALDYLVKAENMLFREAVEAVAGIPPATSAMRLMRGTQTPKTLILPEKAGTPLRLHDYLCRSRGIDRDIVDTLLQDGKLYEDKRGNVVFIGYDEQGRARSASLRGTHGDSSFRMDCAGSDKRYGFSMACAPSERLYIFESAIDAMSHATLENLFAIDGSAWLKHSRLSLAGTSPTAMLFLLNKHKTIKELVFCLDNDRAGREAAINMARIYAGIGYHTRLELPTSKDYNLDLLDYRAIQGLMQRRRGLWP